MLVIKPMFVAQVFWYSAQISQLSIQKAKCKRCNSDAFLSSVSQTPSNLLKFSFIFCIMLHVSRLSNANKAIKRKQPKMNSTRIFHCSPLTTTPQKSWPKLNACQAVVKKKWEKIPGKKWRKGREKCSELLATRWCHQKLTQLWEAQHNQSGQRMPQYPAYFQLLSSTRLFTLEKIRKYGHQNYTKNTK